MRKTETYKLLVREFNHRVAHYNKGKRTDRWEGSNPDDRDYHGREVGFIEGLEWVIDTLFPEMKKP